MLLVTPVERYHYMLARLIVGSGIAESLCRPTLRYQCAVIWLGPFPSSSGPRGRASGTKLNGAVLSSFTVALLGRLWRQRTRVGDLEQLGLATYRRTDFR